MQQHLATKKLSSDAQAVLGQGRKLWSSFFSETDPHSVRKDLRLNRPDVGWHQIRNALKLRNAGGDFPPVSTTAFENAYSALTQKIRPDVYTFGFLQKDD